MADPLLQVEGLSKRFGGVVASDTITFDVPAGELHAVIGPNGAGKTTLISQLAGEMISDAGQVRFGGADITALPTWRRSQLGLARSFQITSLFLDFTALDNVALAVQAHSGHSFRFWRAARREAELREPAKAALARVGLGRARRRAGLQSQPRRTSPARDRDGARHQAAHAAARRADGRHGARGERRAWSTTLARAQARPDHPADRARHGGGVRARRPASPCLVYGRIIASGTPEAIRANAEVRQAYLGEQEAVHG